MPNKILKSQRLKSNRALKKPSGKKSQKKSQHVIVPEGEAYCRGMYSTDPFHKLLISSALKNPRWVD